MATTNHSPSMPLARTAGPERTGNRWTDIWSPATISRAAGLCALAAVAIFLVPTGSNLHSDMTARQVLTWVSHNQQAIWTDGFLAGTGNTLFALLIVLMVALTMDRGILANAARVGAAAGMATGWIHSGVEYALGDLAHRGGADAGILALFSLAKTMDYTDGIAWAVAVGCVSVLLMRRSALPSPVAWLGIVVAAQLIVSFPIQLAISGTGNGPQGPISVLTGILWFAVIGIVLLVKPIRLPEAPDENVQATA